MRFINLNFTKIEKTVKKYLHPYVRGNFLALHGKSGYFYKFHISGENTVKAQNTDQVQ